MKEVLMKREFIAFIFLISTLQVVFVGCVQAPTKVYSTQDIDLQYLNRLSREPVQVTEETVILDARPPFEFAVIHHPKAVNVQWTDFADVSGPYPGLLRSDLSQEARRLALLGVTPETLVIVTGQGVRGRGEEGRLAWTLFYLGINRVQIVDTDKLGARYSNLLPPPRPNAEPWEPVLRPTIMAQKNEVIRVATSKSNNREHILDVRSKEEYFSKNRQLEYEQPDLRAVHIEWKEFFTVDGRPNRGIRDQLRAINIEPNDRVIVISNNGVRSGAVTFALLSLGYKNAANYAGGYSELLKTQVR